MLRPGGRRAVRRIQFIVFYLTQLIFVAIALGTNVQQDKEVSIRAKTVGLSAAQLRALVEEMSNGIPKDTGASLENRLTEIASLIAHIHRQRALGNSDFMAPAYSFQEKREDYKKETHTHTFYKTEADYVIEKIREKRMSGKAEEFFEQKLTAAIIPNDPVTRQQACQTVCQVLDNYSKWRESPEKAHPFGNRPDFRSSFEFTFDTLESLVFVRAAPICPNARNVQKMQAALEEWMCHPYVKYRPQEGDPKVDQFLAAIDNQFRLWGKGYSLLLLNDVLKNPQISLPPLQSLCGGQPPKGNFHDTRGFLQKAKAAFEKNLRADIATFKGREFDYFGNSNQHLFGLMAQLSALPPDVVKDVGGNILQSIVDQVEKKQGGKGCRLPYAPSGGYHASFESNRSSAARCIPYYFAKLLLGGATPEAVKDMRDALKNYTTHVGSLIAQIPRNSTHAKDSDALAPYYFAPSIVIAMSAASTMVNIAKRTGEGLSEASQTYDTIARASLSEYMPSLGRFTSPGRQDYGSSNKLWSTVFPTVALTGVCRADLGAYEGIVPPEIRAEEKQFAAGDKNADKNKEPKQAEAHKDKIVQLEKAPEKERPEDKQVKVQPIVLDTQIDSQGNRPWLGTLADRRFTLSGQDKVLEKLNHWRELAHASTSDPAARDKLRQALAKQIYGLSVHQREDLEKEMRGITLDKSAATYSSDQEILTTYRNALTASAARDRVEDDAILKEARDRSERWNDTLFNVVDAKGNVHPDKQVTVVDPSGAQRTMKGQDWIDAQVAKFTHDGLMRWATSVGGETGNRTIAMLLYQRPGSEDKDGKRLAIVEASKSIPLGDGKSSIEKEAALLFSTSGNSDLVSQMRRYLPLTSRHWDNVQFVSPKAIVSGQRRLPSQQFQLASAGPILSQSLAQQRPESSGILKNNPQGEAEKLQNQAKDERSKDLPEISYTPANALGTPLFEDAENYNTPSAPAEVALPVSYRRALVKQRWPVMFAPGGSSKDNKATIHR